MRRRIPIKATTRLVLECLSLIVGVFFTQILVQFAFQSLMVLPSHSSLLPRMATMVEEGSGRRK
jgi:hypothetical protein